MNLNLSIARGARTASLAAGLVALSAASAFADAPTPNKGDTSWMLISTALVIMMTIPGLALFYAGLVRSKNVLSVLMQVFAGFSLIALLWVVYGYSLAFSGNASSALNPFIGGFDKLFLKGVLTADPVAGMSFANAATFSKGVVIPEIVYVIFQLTFAAITPALIVGAFAERMKFGAVLLFLTIWFTFSYLPIAHMVWFWAGPDAFTLAASNLDAIKGALGEESAQKFLAALTAAGENKEAVAKVLSDFSDAVTATGGFLYAKGAIDFAGGTVVHINAGIAGLVAAIVLGPRVGLGKDNMAPHNLPLSVIGACLLWVGWFGFNAGSNLEANGLTGLAFLNTIVATAAAALAWTFVEWLARGHASALGAISGAVAGLVAVTPASGFAGPMGSIVIGVAAGVICFWAVTWLKGMFKYDDSLDVFGVHGVGGIVGAILTGVFVNPGLGGVGVTNYAAVDATSGMVPYVLGDQVTSQLWAVGTSVVVSGVVSLVALLIIKAIFGIRVSEQAEREGLDISTHGERGYN
ncbi:ammonium transporter [Siculibacillus lacustris]|uniref:Ammonium transporter n=1 Tax=Siculibacillus lacustris TaxID=1549641 RepID=A0A4Q9VLG2_9HYPH|nr:ammonium transporter [Siculibacillus lacustris]TBW36328.1 ammonium transporter [Siculibacillus lacustris]